VADVKWIKIVIDIFNDEKMLFIEQLPDADSIIVIWFKLLTLAGKINNGGVLLFNESMPYTDEMLATIFRRPINTVRLALKTFEEFEMVEIVNHTITIPNWSKHQNLDQLQERKEYMKKYMRKYRENQKQLASGDCKVNSKVNSKANVNSLEVDIEVDKERDKERDIDIGTKSPAPQVKSKIPYQQIVDSFNNICKDLPQVQVISDKRKRAIKKMWEFVKKDIEVLNNLFNKTQESEYLTGKINGWKASFDWIMRVDKAVEIMEGNYANRVKFNNSYGKKQTIEEQMQSKGVQSFLDGERE